MISDQLKTNLTKVTHARPHSDCPWYSPARDITTLLPVIIADAIDTWDEVGHDHKRILERLGRRDVEVNRVIEGLADFMGHDSLIDEQSFEGAYRKTGLADIPPEIRLPLMATIAEEMLGAFWYAARSAITQKDDEDNFYISQHEPEVIARKAKKITRVLRLPKWKRKMVMWWWSLKENIKNKLNIKD